MTKQDNAKRKVCVMYNRVPVGTTIDNFVVATFLKQLPLLSKYKEIARNSTAQRNTTKNYANYIACVMFKKVPVWIEKIT